MHLKDHPRLYIGQAQLDRLTSPADTPAVTAAARRVRRLAKTFASDPTIEVDERGHNYHLIRARKMQTRVVTLLTAYRMTGRTAYRDAVMDDVRRIAGWEYWSWITWRKGDARPEAIFDLSYGENSATLAIACDLLFDELTEAEKRLFVETARDRSFVPYLAVNGGRQKSGYFGSPNSNWNTVCSGGAGMLALAVGEEVPESSRVLDLVERSVAPFFESLEGDGGWPEGIGYWNYGMRYGFMYLLCHERATGRQHRLLRRKGTEATLSFPLNFTPNGLPCSFGDVNSYSPLPFHLAAAERFGRDDLIAELDRRFADAAPGPGPWPTDAELVLLHPGVQGRGRQVDPHRLVAGLEWGYVADRMPEPGLYVSVRGGTTDAPHVHHDLMSFHLVVNRQKLVENIPVQDYIDTTFSPRRFELYETSAASKNTVFVNGVGVADRTSVETTVLDGRGYRGFRFDATEAMGEMRDGPAATFCGRAILMLKRDAILVIDRFVVPHAALVESRMHTFKRVRFSKETATILGRGERLHVSYASTEPFYLKPGTGMQTHPPTDGDTILRCVSRQKIYDATIATLMVPNGTGSVTVTERGKRTIVRADGDVSGVVGFDTATFGL